MNMIKRIEQMEAIMDSTNEQLTELNNLLDKLEASKESVKQFNRYYGSQDWYADREAKLPSTIKCGVLGEDLPYETLTEYRQAAIRLLELATWMVKEI